MHMLWWPLQMRFVQVKKKKKTKKKKSITSGRPDEADEMVD